MRAVAGVVVFAVGLAVGLGVTLVAPDALRPYLPVSLGGTRRTVEAEVLRKQREGERLLLVLSTSEGRMLATFDEKSNQVDLLVGDGDRLLLRLASRSPFVDDPEILRVTGAMKAPPRAGEAARPASGVPAPDQATSPTAEPQAPGRD